MAVTGLNLGERVALTLLLTKDSGAFRNLNTGGAAGAVQRATNEVARLRGAPADGVANLNELFDGNGHVQTTANVAAALGFANDNFYNPGGACPPAGQGDQAVYRLLKDNL